jgi:hypothetical protein
MAMPGTYKVSVSKTVDGVSTEIAGPVKFAASVLSNSSLPAPERKSLVQFQREVAALQRAVLGAARVVDDVKGRVALIKKALGDIQAPAANLRRDVDSLEANLRGMTRVLTGDRTLASRNEPALPSVVDLVGGVVDDEWQSTGAPTQTQRDAFAHAADVFAPLLARLHTLVEKDLRDIENQMERLGAPWTPGRVPDWKKGERD